MVTGTRPWQLGERDARNLSHASGGLLAVYAGYLGLVFGVDETCLLRHSFGRFRIHIARSSFVGNSSRLLRAQKVA